MNIFNWFFKTSKPVTVTKQAVQRYIYLTSGLTYNADLEQSEYTLVPDRDWVLKNCKKSKPWQKKWNCTKIAFNAMAQLQTHAVGMVKVTWPDEQNTHTLLLVVFENRTVVLFDPHSRVFHPLEDKKIYRLWM